MVKRTKEEWRGLFAEQAGSGMTERGFCLDHGLCQKYFNLRKKQLGLATKAPRPSAFVRVQNAPPLEIPRTPSVVLRLGRCELELRDVSSDWLVGLIKALA
jgi:hypothetical protein